MTSMNNNRGFTLIELIIVILIIGIIAAVTTRQMSNSIESSLYEQTKKEMDQLAQAITGDPHLYSDNSRVDFGYVGDVGALPVNFDALVENPGYDTWNGPYMTRGFNGDDFKKDAWNSYYAMLGTTIRSTGSGSNIDKVFAISSAELLNNNFEGVVFDANHSVPGTTYRDSVSIRLIYPDGMGSMTTAVANPSAQGNFSFASLPIGNHVLQVLYLPDGDTLSYPVSIMPGKTAKMNITFPADLW
ncbi:MAG: carboxypeptidase-like regulatory domain-containing protein [Candidatus Zixiibacteriota bacterium]